jgi:Fe-S-cluster containining protein
MPFVCDRCSHCCRHHRVPLTDQDVERMRPVAPQNESDWLDMVPVAALDMEGEPETVVETRQGRRVLVLRHVQGGCVFLGPQGCTVHAERPRSCRSYPYDRPQNSDSRLGLHPEPLCPVETGIRDLVQQTVAAQALEQQREFELEIQTRDEELRSYAEFVTQYNRKQRVRLRLFRQALPPQAFLTRLRGNEY